jgi:hypothetical protein
VLEQGADDNVWTKETWSVGSFRQLNNEDLHDLYSFPNISGMVKSRRMQGQGM